VYALPGYYCLTEYTAPVQCLVAKACAGQQAQALEAAAGADVTSASVDSGCSSGYAGDWCAQCASGYYQLKGSCYPCGSAASAQAALLLCTLLAAVWVLFLGGMVAFAPAEQLSRLVLGLVCVQLAALLCVSGTRDLSQSASSAALYLSTSSTGTWRWCGRGAEWSPPSTTSTRSDSR